MFHIPGPDTVIHPRTVVVHVRYTSMTDTTVMTPGWLVGLTLGTHGQLVIVILIIGRSLLDRGNGTRRDTAGVGQ